ncbi:DUF4336 domain-containing protein [Pyruvatibacter sp.]|uniref:DUF4336 domain-containing protein n=1 Tax=Pyruvatibacter sp. TaxID=1981328 RepID=UPI0032EC477B
MEIRQQFGPEIWTMDGDSVRMFGIVPFTTRMTVVRLESGGLWIHSPIAPTQERLHFVNELGPVGHLVAPNKIHSRGIEPWKAHYPSAKVWASPGFSMRHPNIAIDEVLKNGVETDWSGEISHCVVDGHAVLDEVVFLHKPSRTLIITDFIQKHEAARESWFWRGVKSVAGILGNGGGVPLDVKLSIRDKAAFRRSIGTILKWDFENLVLAHGQCLRGGAKKDVSLSFSWIMKSSSLEE